ncbi:hypothetical protein J606_3056 [Acinetobacter baumannii 318814]|nr:hypothetical protein J606_3056 [Acinetobacter baumannii 318814]
MNTLVQAVGKYSRNWFECAHPTGKFFQTPAECEGHNPKRCNRRQRGLKPK